MVKLTEAKRDNLSNTEYACPRDRKLPINDAAHVRNAMSRFDQVQSNFCHPTVAKRRIMKAAKKFGIDVKDFGKVRNFQSTKKK
jgi:hypothetical protein